MVLGVTIAAPLWRKQYTTFGDLFRERYSPGVERLAVILMVPTSVLWAAAQIRAFGQVVSAASELEVSIAITAAAGFVIIYTVTVDSCLLAAASLVSHNIIVPLAPSLSERGKIWCARGGVISFGVLAYVIALYAGGIYGARGNGVRVLVAPGSSLSASSVYSATSAEPAARTRR